MDLSYYSQHDQELRGDRTIIDTILGETALTRTQARTLLGAFLFPGNRPNTTLPTFPVVSGDGCNWRS